jgi:hypothetical protein
MVVIVAVSLVISAVVSTIFVAQKWSEELQNMMTKVMEVSYSYKLPRHGSVIRVTTHYVFFLLNVLYFSLSSAIQLLSLNTLQMHGRC